MGFFVVGNLKMRGGSVQLGADTNLYRKAANQLATDDGMHFGGTVGVVGASQFTAAATFNGAMTVNAVATGGTASGINMASGTQLIAPYATASPTVDTNGHVSFVQKANRSYLSFQCGGTPFHVMFPQTTHGTITVTVGGTP